MEIENLQNKPDEEYKQQREFVKGMIFEANEKTRLEFGKKLEEKLFFKAMKSRRKKTMKKTKVCRGLKRRYLNRRKRNNEMINNII